MTPEENPEPASASSAGQEPPASTPAAEEPRMEADAGSGGQKRTAPPLDDVELDHSRVARRRLSTADLLPVPNDDEEGLMASCKNRQRDAFLARRLQP